MNKKKISELTITLQLLITVVIVVFIILYFINHKFINFLELFIGVDFALMSINNFIVYKRKGLTPLYFVFAIITILISVWGFIHG